MHEQGTYTCSLIPAPYTCSPPIQLPRRLSGARRQLCWAPPALSWGAVGANLVWTSGLSNKKRFFEKQFSPRQRSCPGQVVCSKKKRHCLRKHLSQATKLPGTCGLFKNKNLILRKSSPPGSGAARDKWPIQSNKSFFEEKNCPRQRSCSGQVASSKNIFFDEKFCPRQRSCPGQVACSKNGSCLRRVLPNRITRK